MSYPKITDAAVERLDKYGTFNAIAVGSILQNLSTNQVSPLLTGGTTGTTVTERFFVTPEKIKVTGAKFFLDTANTGSGNVPVINLKSGSVVLATGSSPLSGAANDVIDLTLNATAANLLVAKNTVLTIEIVTPSETITVAVKGKLQLEYNTVA